MQSPAALPRAMLDRAVGAAHPVPDAAGVAATRRVLDPMVGLGEGDLLLALDLGRGLLP